MAKSFFILLLFAFAAHAQVQKPIAILNTVDDSKPELDFTELTYLTSRLREIAVKMLPEDKYDVLTSERIIEILGPERKEECKNKCMLEMGKEISADYIGQARLGRLGGNLTITMNLFNVVRGNLIGSFTGEAKDLSGLLTVINENAPAMFRKMLGISSGPIFEPGIYNAQTSGGDYEFAGEKPYLVNISSDPEGANLSFNGIPDERCAKTPCGVELREGSVRIIAVLEQYERADTTVSIKQNNQSIRIRMKANFGVLEIKPAYSDGIGRDERWSLTINGKTFSSFENRLSPNKYSVELSHRCYGDISFEAGINKDKREVFDMASQIRLKKGGLVLSAEADGEPVSEPVFVNGKQVGETPFSGAVPLCAKVEIGKDREMVDIKLEHNDKVTHTVKNIGGVSGGYLTDSRDGKRYKVVNIGRQMWMAENLNYNANGSRCYANKSANCDKYGRLYNWETAKTACPKGWHLPSGKEWDVLEATVGDEKIAEKVLRAKSGWNSNNGTDAYGFSALPGGYGDSEGYFGSGSSSVYWIPKDISSSDAYLQGMYYLGERIRRSKDAKSVLFSVRCLRDQIDVDYNVPTSIDNDWGINKAEKHDRDLLREPMIGIGFGYLNVGNIDPAYNKNNSVLSINPEFVSIFDGHLRFGADVDFGFIEKKEDNDSTTRTYSCRGGASAKLSLGKYNWLYLTTGAGWYVDKSHSDPSFSIGGGLRLLFFVDMQYYIISMDNRNANYWTIKGGLSLPFYSMLRDMKEKSEQSGDERKVRRRK
ncbi:MAG: PEGA domain-containing protein [Fibromonadaceae bacterium]|nr:PEGA domain-containing protein [Fibromonadaceae bacterium]